MTIFEQIIDILYHSILLLLHTLQGPLLILTFMMKTSLMENLAADYVRTAIAKGVPFKKAVVKHAAETVLFLDYTLWTIITVFLGGSFLIEKIFNIDGLGLLAMSLLLKRLPSGLGNVGY